MMAWSCCFVSLFSLALVGRRKYDANTERQTNVSTERSMRSIEQAGKQSGRKGSRQICSQTDRQAGLKRVSEKGNE